MGGVEPMNDLEIMDRQAKLIEHQRRLFINTAEQFKKDVVYLKGCVRVLMEMCDDTDPIINGLPHVIDHILEMESMLNNFDARMKDYD